MSKIELIQTKTKQKDFSLLIAKLFLRNNEAVCFTIVAPTKIAEELGESVLGLLKRLERKVKVLESSNASQAYLVREIISSFRTLQEEFGIKDMKRKTEQDPYFKLD